MSVRVVVIDDSITMRTLIASRLSGEPGIEVVATACDAAQGREAIRNLDPDVVTLDVEMPGMDGLDFLERIMALRPTPVIIVSGTTGRGTRQAARALSLGAIACLAKDQAGGIGDGAELAALVREAAQVRFARKPAAMATKPTDRQPLAGANDIALVVIGASTGGVEALHHVLSRFPVDCPPTLVVQHINASFAASVARSLDQACPPRVMLGESGMMLERGTVCVAPGATQHMMVGNLQGQQPRIRLRGGEPVCGHRPSIDALFASVAENAARGAIGVLLTGMGRDGARGLLAMAHAGARTIVQDKESSVVFGMPRAAIELGAAQSVVPLDLIADAILGRVPA